MFDKDDFDFPDESDNDPSENHEAFLQGANMFLTIAQLFRNDERSAKDLMKQMLDEINGNRKHPAPDKVFPELYKKIVEYCHAAVAMSSGPDDRL